MAQPPKTPTPPRRKAATTRKTTRAPSTRKTASPSPAEGDGTDTAASPATPTPPAPTRKRRATTGTAASGTTRKPRAKPAESAKPAAAASRKRTTAAKPSTKPAHAASGFVSETRDRLGDRNFFAALIGGAAAMSAAVVGVMYAMRDANPFLSGGAHQADGTDSSASFEAGIADEGTIPDKAKG